MSSPNKVLIEVPSSIKPLKVIAIAWCIFFSFISFLLFLFLFYYNSSLKLIILSLTILGLLGLYILTTSLIFRLSYGSKYIFKSVKICIIIQWLSSPFFLGIVLSITKQLIEKLYSFSSIVGIVFLYTCLLISLTFFPTFVWKVINHPDIKSYCCLEEEISPEEIKNIISDNFS